MTTQTEALKLALELLAVGTFHSPELQAKRTDVIKQGLEALEQEPCPDKERDEYTCKNRHKCWEPCGELGKSEQHSVVAQQEQEPDYWLGYGLQAYTDKPFEDAKPLYTTPPQHKELEQAPVAWMQEKLIKALDQAANGSHLDDVPNHDNDSVQMIAWSLGLCWQREKLLAHSDRLESALFYANKSFITPTQSSMDAIEIAGLKSSVGHLSAIIDEQRAILVDVERVCGVDGHGGPLEDGESELIDRVRAHLAAIAPPQRKPCQTCEALARTVMLDQSSTDAPQRKPLTDEQKKIMWKQASLIIQSDQFGDYYNQGIADAEFAHGIKENT